MRIRGLVALKHRHPGVWKAVEAVNAFLFCVRKRNLPEVAAKVLSAASGAEYRYSFVEAGDIPGLEAFLKSQPKEYLSYFSPHPFDAETLSRLFRNRAFLMMKVTAVEGDGESLAGYFFLRCFFVGKAFAGLVVDEPRQNRGIGSTIWRICAEICEGTGLKMQATISENNIPSVRSCRKATDMTVVDRFENNYMAITCEKKD